MSCNALNPGMAGVSEKNRAGLRQFDDPANVQAFLALPAKLATQARVRQALQDEGTVRDRAAPGDEMTQVAAAAAQSRGRQVVARQVGEERRHPAWLARDI